MKPICFETLSGVLVWPSGSSYICDPPVINTDEDWLIYSPPELFRQTRELAFANHFSRSAQRSSYTKIAEQRDRFIAYRSLPPGPWRTCPYGNNLNLIITCDLDFYQKFQFATEEAKRLNLLVKDDRINLFQKVFQGKYVIDYDEDDEGCI